MNKWDKTVNKIKEDSDCLTAITVEEEDGYCTIVGWYTDDRRTTLAKCKNKNEAGVILDRVKDLLERREGEYE